MVCANYFRYDAYMLPQSDDAHWQARLQLGFARRGDATLLTKRQHFGPLRVQKPLYPEGAAVCQVVLLHPPGGLVGGDTLDIGVDLGPASHALITTPGAAKWYGSAGPLASQQLRFDVAAGALLEWLPQENIFFDGARAALHTQIVLAADARFIGWEVHRLGRRASGEHFKRGEMRLHTRIERAGQPLWLERGRVLGDDALLHSPAGFAGMAVSATMMAVGPAVGADLLAACRMLPTYETEARHAITVLPDLLLARYLGQSPEAARAWFVALWRLLRPALLGRAAVSPRIWST